MAKGPREKHKREYAVANRIERSESAKGSFFFVFSFAKENDTF
jgi:hypothetical protein